MKKEEMTPKQLWRLAQKYNESDFVKILGEIAQLKQEEPREEENPTECEHYWVNKETASEIIVTSMQLCVKCKHIRDATKEELRNPNKSVT